MHMENWQRLFYFIYSFVFWMKRRDSFSPIIIQIDNKPTPRRWSHCNLAINWCCDKWKCSPRRENNQHTSMDKEIAVNGTVVCPYVFQYHEINKPKYRTDLLYSKSLRNLHQQFIQLWEIIKPLLRTPSLIVKWMKATVCNSDDIFPI